MNERAEELLKLRSYTEDIDKDLTMILQSLQWDRKHILQHPTMVPCKYDPNHKVLADKVEEHERECLLRQNGYTKEDHFLPDPLSNTANTLITFSKQDLAQIIDNAVKSDPTFKRVCYYSLRGPKQLCLPCIGSDGLEPQTLARLQSAYSTDERRVIHDAVVSAVPFCHDLTDLALPSVVGEDGQVQKPKTRTEILAELRDMRRRRTKYRVATKSRNYSDVLRDVIKTQMEMYNEVVSETKTRPNIIECNANIDKQIHHDDMHSKDDERDRHEHRTEFNKCERNRDSDSHKKERPYKDQRNKDSIRSRHEDSQSRDHNRERSRDYNRYNNDHRTRNIDDPNIYKEESRDIKHIDRSKERGYDERRDRDNRRKDRRFERHDDEQSREYKKQDRTREYDRFTAKHNIQEYSDTERDRKSVTDIKHEHSDRSKDRHVYTEDRSRDRKRQRDSRESGSNEYRDRYNTLMDSHKIHKDSHRDKCYEKEAKKARTADKHKSYNEIYTELDKRRRKDRDSDNDCK